MIINSLLKQQQKASHNDLQIQLLKVVFLLEILTRKLVVRFWLNLK